MTHWRGATQHSFHRPGLQRVIVIICGYETNKKPGRTYRRQAELRFCQEVSLKPFKAMFNVHYCTRSENEPRNGLRQQRRSR